MFFITLKLSTPWKEDASKTVDRITISVIVTNNVKLKIHHSQDNDELPDNQNRVNWTQNSVKNRGRLAFYTKNTKVLLLLVKNIDTKNVGEKNPYTFFTKTIQTKLQKLFNSEALKASISESKIFKHEYNSKKVLLNWLTSFPDYSPFQITLLSISQMHSEPDP